MHLACVPVLWLAPSWPAIAVCLALYWLRMFGITGGFHRYFSHRSYKTSRLFQFGLAWLGTSAAQLGPLWWASHHRKHHAHSDTEKDVHPPGLRGFVWAHLGWIFAPENKTTDLSKVKDLARYPELVWLDRYPLVPPFLLALAVLWLGVGLERVAPDLGVSGAQMLVWGFFVSTVVLYHATFCINSLAHLVGSRRYDTHDDSRNSLFLALLTMGEGWHNNHHQYPSSERQGFYWWEIDLTHYLLVGLARLGLVWDLRQPPASAFSDSGPARGSA
ncbi:MAG: acyl-CoA desaturase [Candidatus Eremiobacteraeota bacterium]|nr:acyl-CoA desaturase [Candidatus Eremiobacteraeota bacterium]